MTVRVRNNVTEHGNALGTPMVLVHGFGCDQNMWRHVWPRFADTHRIVLFDYVGAGGSDLSAYDPDRYGSLAGYAQDILDVVEDLDLHDVVLVGHSVSAMTGALACRQAPERFSALVMVAPSPRYIDEGDYVGGFGEDDIRELLASLDSNYLGWSTTMAPVIMGRPDAPELGEELAESFCRADPEIARRFAHVTFLSDHRADLPQVTTPTLVLQCRDDVIAPVAVGEYVTEHLPDASMVLLDATGHCPNLSAPQPTADAIEEFLRTRHLVGT
jgi:sigma-B regulation protein RsbQ